MWLKSDRKQEGLAKSVGHTGVYFPKDFIYSFKSEYKGA